MEKLPAFQAGQKLWFVPVDQKYGPPREIEIYLSGKIWACFKDEWYKGRILQYVGEVEFGVGLIYRNKSDWLKGAADVDQIHHYNASILEALKISLPIIIWFFGGCLFGFFVAKISHSADIWEAWNLPNYDNVLVDSCGFLFASMKAWFILKKKLV
jgi:hypothetical protein